MLILGFFSPFWQLLIGCTSVLCALGVYVYGEHNDVVTWPWSIAVLLLSPLILPIFIMVQYISGSLDDIWADPKERKRDELDFHGLPSRWKRSYREDVTRRKRTPPD